MSKAAVVLVSLLALVATLLGCGDNTCTNTNGDGSPISTGGGGAGGAAACECFTPPNVDLECRVIHPDDTHMSCITDFLGDFAPCRSGVGVCINSVCTPPIGSECRQKIFAGPWASCKTAADCDDGNPCTIDTCPAPGCDTCKHEPRPDFMLCGDNVICIQGACCAGPLPS